MDTIKPKQRATIFAALKFIEQLYLDNLIPEYIFHNILRDYLDQIDTSEFLCHKDNKQRKGEK